MPSSARATDSLRGHQYAVLENDDGDTAGLVNDGIDEPKKHTDDLEEALDDLDDLDGNAFQPTEVELKTLRRVSGHIPWQTYSIAFVELCERFSWYGTTAVFVNFIQQPLPPGSSTGSAGTSGQAGALGLGQRTSTSITMFNSFFAYTTPLIGAIIADKYLGRLRTISYAIRFALVGHCILITSSLPFMIARPHSALPVFIAGLLFMGLGTGGFKSNISPLLAEQIPATHKRISTLPTGERVIVDPIVTISRLYMYFYLMINIGSLLGGTSMVYAEKYLGFWAAFSLPTLMFCLCPLVLSKCQSQYRQTATTPGQSTLTLAFRVYLLALRQHFRTRRNHTTVKLPFWDAIKPHNLPQPHPPWLASIPATYPSQIARGFTACKVFAWFPLYWLAYNQMVNNLTSQSATMTLNGIPNDILNNLNPLCLILVIPLMDKLIYPCLRHAHINFTPIKRITFGFLVAALAMFAAMTTQSYIYRLSPCGYSASTCDTPAPISVWWQSVPYVLIGISEVFASVTGLEYAFTKAPQDMRSLVMGVYLLQTAVSSVLGQLLVPLSADPWLTWNYAVAGLLALGGGVGFWWGNREVDGREDEMNMLSERWGGDGGDEMTGRRTVAFEIERTSGDITHALTGKNLSTQTHI